MAVTTPPRPSLVSRSRESLSALFGAKELVAALVSRELRVRHRGTALGMLWSLATPAMTVALYTFIFGVIFHLSPAPGSQIPFAVHFFCGLVLWNFFNTAVLSSVGSIVGSGYLLRKVYFPRAILPLSNVLSALVTLGFEFAVLLVIMLITGIRPDVWIVASPLIIAVVFVFSFGLGLFLSTLTVFFRDVAHFIGILMQVWFWGTPIIYSLELVKGRPKLEALLLANPMTPLVTAFRRAILGEGFVETKWLVYSGVCAVIALIIGSITFARQQKMFPELV